MTYPEDPAQSGQPGQPYESAPPPPPMSAQEMAAAERMSGGPQIASMGQRLGARVIDVILLSIVGAIIVGPQLGGLEPGEAPGAGYYGAASLAGLVGLLYEVILIAVKGQTLGKMALGIQVRNIADGSLPGWGPSILRYLIQLVGSFACGIGLLVVWISPFFDNTGKRQGWHDKVAKTVVIKA